MMSKKSPLEQLILASVIGSWTLPKSSDFVSACSLLVELHVPAEIILEAR